MATFICSMVFFTAANASAALVAYTVWCSKWYVCACATCCRSTSCDSKRDGTCGGFGFGVWRRFFEHL